MDIIPCHTNKLNERWLTSLSQLVDRVIIRSNMTCVERPHMIPNQRPCLL